VPGGLCGVRLTAVAAGGRRARAGHRVCFAARRERVGPLPLGPQPSLTTLAPWFARSLFVGLYLMPSDPYFGHVGFSPEEVEVLAGEERSMVFSAHAAADAPAGVASARARVRQGLFNNNDWVNEETLEFALGEVQVLIPISSRRPPSITRTRATLQVELVEVTSLSLASTEVRWVGLCVCMQSYRSEPAMYGCPSCLQVLAAGASALRQLRLDGALAVRGDLILALSGDGLLLEPSVVVVRAGEALSDPFSIAATAACAPGQVCHCLQNCRHFYLSCSLASSPVTRVEVYLRASVSAGAGNNNRLPALPLTVSGAVSVSQARISHVAMGPEEVRRALYATRKRAVDVQPALDTTHYTRVALRQRKKQPLSRHRGAK
jgi:hypothetical protein